MGDLTILITEYAALSPLSTVVFWLSIGGISVLGLVNWFVSLTKLGRARRIEEGLRAEILEVQQRNARQAREMHTLREQKRALEPESRLQAIDVALSKGELRNYSSLIEKLPGLVGRDAIILTKLAKYYASLSFSMEPEHLSKACNYAMAAHYLDKGLEEAQYYAFELQAIAPTFDKIIGDSLSKRWDAGDSDPALFIASVGQITQKLHGLSYHYISLALAERAFHIARNCVDLPEPVMCFAARNMCEAFAAVQDAAAHEACAREELARMGEVDPEAHGISHGLIIQRHLSAALVMLGRSEEALEILEDVVPKMTSHLGPEDVSTLVARQSRTNALYDLGRPDVNECRRIARAFAKQLGPAASHTIVAQQCLSAALQKSGKQKVAEKILRYLDRRHRRRLGEHHQLIRRLDQMKIEFAVPG